jgi:hypothetical protein
LTFSRSLRDIRAISLAWLSPFFTGNPETTIYASPIVSTFKDRDNIITLLQVVIWPLNMGGPLGPPKLEDDTHLKPDNLTKKYL